MDKSKFETHFSKILNIEDRIKEIEPMTNEEQNIYKKFADAVSYSEEDLKSVARLFIQLANTTAVILDDETHDQVSSTLQLTKR